MAPVRPRLESALLIAGVMVLAINLRPGVASLPPIFDEMHRQMGITNLEITALATTPVTCFAVFAFVSSGVSQRYGDERTIGAAIAFLVLGLAVRPFFGAFVLFAGTLLAAASIAVMNVLVASLIRRRHPERAGVILGCYFLFFALGQSIAPALSVPVYLTTGHTVSVPMVIWAAPAAVGFLIWLPQLRRTSRPTQVVQRLPFSSRTAWWVALFMAGQSFTFYAASSFLPDIFRDRGATPSTAGFLAAAMGLGGLAVSFGTPVVAARLRHQAPLVTAGVALVVIGITGCVDGSLRLEYLSAAVLGMGQGMLQPLAIYLTVVRAANSQGVPPLSAMAQGVGYMIALLCPVTMGVLRYATGSWVIPGVAVVTVALATLVVGWLASRPSTVALPSLHGATTGD